MHVDQQKQADSQGEFEVFTPEVETINHLVANQHSAEIKSKHPRLKQLSEKQKLGLVVTPSLTQPQYSPATYKLMPNQNGKIIKVGTVTFRSNFQSGNIGSVDLIGVNTFKISLDQQTNSGRNNSWFFFTVEGIKGEAHFVIKGFTKRTSLYNQGMKVCCRDSKENKWRRGGTHITYESYEQDEEEDKIYCLKFSYFFKSNQYSSIDFAYSFPYSLHKLNAFLCQLSPKVRVTSLGTSFDGRSIPLITVGNANSKEVIIISGRVHPGETISSFIAQGFIKEVISDCDHAKFLRQRFLIKIIPMINVDGVCRGNYRFSAAGVDLNRKWKQPSEHYHPEIYLLKQLIKKENKDKRIKMFVDLHGHSRKKNVFFYGCCRNSQQEDDYSKAKAFPYLMSKIHNAFSYEDCSFNIQKDKEGTARVALFKELKINQIFTLQASFCGLSNGVNFTEADYEKVGANLCLGIGAYFYEVNSSKVHLSSKLMSLKESSMQQLQSTPYLLKVGNEENSGSDSQPEKGELPQKRLNQTLTKRELTRKRASNLSTAQTYNRITPKVPTSLKQKSQASIAEHNNHKDHQFYRFLLQAPSKLLEADFRQRDNCLKNQRVHSTNKQSAYQKHTRLKVASFFEEGSEMRTLTSEKPVEKNKIYLMIGRQGAQYRRVRKIVEQNLKQEHSEKLTVQVRGIKGNQLEIEHPRTIPRLGIAEKSKYRRTSAEMFFRKPIRIEEKPEFNKIDVSVHCRGRQIIF